MPGSRLAAADCCCLRRRAAADGIPSGDSSLFCARNSVTCSWLSVCIWSISRRRSFRLWFIAKFCRCDSFSLASRMRCSAKSSALVCIVPRSSISRRSASRRAAFNSARTKLSSSSLFFWLRTSARRVISRSAIMVFCSSLSFSKDLAAALNSSAMAFRSALFFVSAAASRFENSSFMSATSFSCLSLLLFARASMPTILSRRSSRSSFAESIFLREALKASLRPSFMPSRARSSATSISM
mmetsp:Transcript_91374/g.263083  ORF Transcript_91374/g.263083 Transcript_91374/m.263083 type:complete len:241 (-) Transcript_91374:272-994(-)